MTRDHPTKRRTPSSRGRGADPVEKDIATTLEPGAFIGYRACSSFIARLADVDARMRKLAKTDPARASRLYETFLAGCFEKASELDGSSGEFGEFVVALFCGWIEARQAAGSAPRDTAARLLAWMDDDPYCFCYEFEEQVAKAFDKAGLAAFEGLLRARFDAATAASQSAEGKLRDQAASDRRHWSGVLRTLYVQQRAVGAYITLAEETGVTAKDCLAIARLLVGRRKPQDALAWIERGVGLDEKFSGAAHDLARLKRDLLTKLGRGGEALEGAWAEFQKHPSKYAYDDLMKLVPKAERSSWHEKAIHAAEGADLRSHMELLLETRELERLAGLIRRSSDSDLEGLSHYTTEPAAKKVEKSWPDAAARLWRAQGLRILGAKKSEYYAVALANLQRARGCFNRAGLTSEWDTTVSDVRSAHHRKTGFMPGFEDLVRGSGPNDQPSFLDRAKARWVRREG